MVNKNDNGIRTKIPDLSSGDIGNISEAVNVILGRKGKTLDRAVTFRDLRESGFLVDQSMIGTGSSSISSGVSNTGPFQGDADQEPDFGQNDLTKPIKPRNVRAAGINLQSIGISWSEPGYNNHSYAEVFGSTANDLDSVLESFNPLLPISPLNQSQFFVGTSSGTFLHHNRLESTLPEINVNLSVAAFISISGNTVTLILNDRNDSFSPGDEVYFSSQSGWVGDGITGTVTVSSEFEITVLFSSSVPEYEGNIFINKSPSQDDLDKALNPDEIYYWVRFVSTANIVGDFHSREGVSASVAVDPERVLDILTGRIKDRHISSELLRAINFVRGPINQLDDSGNRKHPTVRDFVLSLGDDIVSEYDEVLNQVFLGFLSGSSISSASCVAYNRINNSTINLYSRDILSPLSIGDTVTLRPSLASVVSSLDGEVAEIIQPRPFVSTDEFPGLYKYTLSLNTSAPLGSNLDIEPMVMVLDSDYSGVSSAAAYISRIKGSVDESESFIETLETLQAAFEVEGEDVDVTGISSIVSTIANRQLVKASDDGALAYIADTMQVEFGDGSVSLNQASQTISSNEDKILNSITFKGQQNIGGVVYSAGFGIGIETQFSGETVSTFAVAADEFVVMSSGNNGRVVEAITSVGSGSSRRYIIRCKALNGNTSVIDGLLVGERVTVTIPNSSPGNIRQALQNRVFVVDSRSPSGDSINITVSRPEGEPSLLFLNEQDLAEGFNIFPEQSIPFIINTETSTVGIRGRLIVDGMITATEAQITGLLTANEIWAGNITAFGLIQTQSLIGNSIATPRVGGWSVKMSSVDTSFSNRVFEFSRWGSVDDETPTGDDITNQASQFPQLTSSQPIDTSFSLSADGSVFVRGNLTVAGNARFWTGYQSSNTEYFVQIDQEFPIYVFPRSMAESSGIPTSDGASVNYTNFTINQVRRNALFWANKNGTAGFNTTNGGVYVDTNPIAPVNGYGFVSVIPRLSAQGGTINTGRVHIDAQFSLADNSNQIGPDAVMGCTIALFLVDASTDYADNSETIVPSSRNGTGNVNISPISTFMDTHFLIIRSATDNSGSNGDPGYRAYVDWITRNNLFGSRVHEFFQTSSNRIVISGAIETVASNNYRALVVIVERFTNEGVTVFGGSGNVTLPYSGSVFSQQVAQIDYTGPVGSNNFDGDVRSSYNPNSPAPILEGVKSV